MPGIDPPQAHAKIQQSLSGHLVPPDRTQNASQASMLSEILNSYSSDARQPSPARYDAAFYDSRMDDGDAQHHPKRALPQDGLVNGSPHLFDHSPGPLASADSDSSTPPPPSPTTPNTTTPPHLSIRPIRKRGTPAGADHSPSHGAASKAKDRMNGSRSTSGDMPANDDRTSSQEKPQYWLDATRPARLQQLGIDPFTAKKSPSLRHKPEVGSLRTLSGEHEASQESPVEEWDAHHMRNVTLRKTRRSDSPKHSTGTFTHSDLVRSPAPDRTSSGSSPNHARHESAGGDQSALHRRAVSNSSAQNQVGERTPEVNMNRWSGSSRNSATVQATVIFPEQHTPKLRHVSKTESLRSGSLSQSNRNSLGSDKVASPSFDSQNQRSQPFNGHTEPAKPRHPTLRRRGDFEVLRRSSGPGETSSYLHDDFPRRGVPSMNADVHLPPTNASAAPLIATDPPTQPGQSAVSLASKATSPEVFHDAASHVTRQPSFDTLHSLPHHPHRLSDDHGLLRATPPQSDRRVSFETGLNYSEGSDRHARFSPMSARSEGTDTFELKEAATMDIYPHSNGSLLVVHHNSRHMMGQNMHNGTTQQVHGGKSLDLERPNPPYVQELRADSPLKNPRQAPLPPSGPPTVEIIPPTPARELDAQDEAEQASDARPVRRTSLLQRARRYSDTVMLPITGSLRRKRGMNSSARSSSAHRYDQDFREDGRLHPFWMPKRFIDISDSEPDDDDDRPATGDSRDSSWRRGGSFRGFLLGNTLGIERDPTNKRRPHISSPLQQTQGPSAPPSSYRPVSLRDSARRSALTTDQGQRRPRDSSLSRLWRDWRARRDNRGEVEAEVRREKLRGNIKLVGGVHQA